MINADAMEYAGAEVYAVPTNVSRGLSQSGGSDTLDREAMAL